MSSKTDWMTGATCADLPDPEVMQDPERVDEARRECAACPVRAMCLSYALDNPELASHGVWGGKTTRERGYLLRRMGRPVFLDVEMDCA